MLTVKNKKTINLVEWHCKKAFFDGFEHGVEHAKNKLVHGDDNKKEKEIISQSQKAELVVDNIFSRIIPDLFNRTDYKSLDIYGKLRILYNYVLSTEYEYEALKDENKLLQNKYNVAIDITTRLSKGITENLTKG